jgi:hypothetical protein
MRCVTVGLPASDREKKIPRLQSPTPLLCQPHPSFKSLLNGIFSPAGAKEPAIQRHSDMTNWSTWTLDAACSSQDLYQSHIHAQLHIAPAKSVFLAIFEVHFSSAKAKEPSIERHSDMSNWSTWYLDAARSSQDSDQWHVYSAENTGGQYTGNYTQMQYSKLIYPEYVVS